MVCTGEKFKYLDKVYKNMKFKDKYTNAVEQDKKKIELSNDAYAIGEIIQALIDKIEQIRTETK